MSDAPLFIRRPPLVSARQVTENLDDVLDIALWCHGRVIPSISGVHSIALDEGPAIRPGDWVGFTQGSGRFFGMTHFEFRETFQPAPTEVPV